MLKFDIDVASFLDSCPERVVCRYILSPASEFQTALALSLAPLLEFSATCGAVF